MPTGSEFIQLFKSGRQAAHPILPVGGSLDILHGFPDNRINLNDILFYIPLRNLKQPAFRLLHQIVHIDCFIESLMRNFGRKRNQLAGQIFLGNDARMIFDVRGRSDLLRQLSHIHGAAGRLQLPSSFQFFHNRQDIYGFLLHGQALDGSKNQLVNGIIKTFGFQNIADHGIRVLFQHQGSQHRLFQLPGLRRQLPHIRGDNGLFYDFNISFALLFLHFQQKLYSEKDTKGTFMYA